MITAVDTTTLLDLLLNDPEHAEASRTALEHAFAAGPVVACPVVYSELGAVFSRQDRVDAFMGDLGIAVDGFNREALWRAAEAWRQYRSRRGSRVQCQACGQPFNVTCPKCATAVQWRQHIISDFLIGAHASMQADVLLTRDRGYFRTFFPKLRLHP